MSLLYKPDWEETKERYRAWWRGEYFGRCGLSVTGRKAGTEHLAPPATPDDPVVHWTDLSYLVALNEWQHATTFWGGEALPVWHGGYPGHTGLQTFLGCPIELDHTTGWSRPILTGEDLETSSLHLHTGGRWWPFALELQHTAAAASEGKSIPSVGAFGGCGDVLAAVRGTEALLFDCLERPDQVVAAELRLMDLWCHTYDALAAPLDQPRRGATCWFCLWAPEKFYATQCDFAYTISPHMFRNLFLPRPRTPDPLPELRRPSPRRNRQFPPPPGDPGTSADSSRSGRPRTGQTQSPPLSRPASPGPGRRKEPRPLSSRRTKSRRPSPPLRPRPPHRNRLRHRIRRAPDLLARGGNVVQRVSDLLLWATVVPAAAAVVSGLQSRNIPLVVLGLLLFAK